MKKCYFALIIVLCFFICLQGCSSTLSVSDSFSASKDGYSMQKNEINIFFNDKNEFLSQMELVCENSKYAFYYDSLSLAIALVDKRDANIYFSNPYDAGMDQYYVDDLKKRLNSQIVLDYVDRKNNVRKQLYSSSDCVEFGQYNVEAIDSGINIKMTIGEIKEEYLVPYAMSEQSFEKFTSKMDDFGKLTMETYYFLTDIKELESGLEKEELSQNFPSLNKEKLYIATELTDRDKKIISEYLVSVGYTKSDFEKDFSLGSSNEDENSNVCVELNLQYRLSENGLTVTIPSKTIKYDNEKFAVTDISVLEFFASDKPIQDGEGYLFIPDGCGALIDIDDSDENRKRSIGGEIYGKDLTISATENEEGKNFLLPVFGVNKNDNSCLFAEIVSGDEISTVIAVLGAPNTQYFRVYNTFRYNTHEMVSTNTKVSSQGSNISSYVISETPYEDDLSICYTPLMGDDSGYMKMAKHYRQKLIGYGLQEDSKNTELKTEINLLGTAIGEDTFLGVNVKKDFVFTDYNSAVKVVDWFDKEEIDNLRLLYTGWQERGLNAGVSGKQKLSSALGGRSDWKKLNKLLEGKSIDLIPTADLIFSAYQYNFDGFSKSSDAARTMKDTYAGTYKYENIKTDETLNYLISPMKYNKLWGKFFKSTKKLITDSVLLEGVGNYLASDAKNDDISNRNTALKDIETIFDAQSKERELWFNVGNAYVLPYAKGVSETVLNNSDFAGETARVPFYQIVTDGLIARSSEDINLSADWQQELLSCVETHTSPRFTLVYENTELLKDTDFTEYFSVDYKILRDRIAEAIKYMNKKLSLFDGEFIIDYQILSDGVSNTVYSNGYSVLVNKTKQAYEYGNIKVSPMDYVVINEGGSLN